MHFIIYHLNTTASCKMEFCLLSSSSLQRLIYDRPKKSSFQSPSYRQSITSLTVFNRYQFDFRSSKSRPPLRPSFPSLPHFVFKRLAILVKFTPKSVASLPFLFAFFPSINEAMEYIQYIGLPNHFFLFL